VRELSDLKPGMELEGVVTNITAFGAFVDVGVHQDGLVHISQLADKFVKDPHDVVKVGDRIQVRVLEVDLDRRRIALTARRGAPPANAPTPRVPATDARRHQPAPKTAAPENRFTNNPFAALRDRAQKPPPR
jgi:uncharacterized protein